MILLEEPLSDRAEVTHLLAESFGEVLDLRWSNYRKALKRCRKRFSEKSVHALRVEIRRMLSTLALLESALPDENIARLQRELKGQRKALSSLRDTQVQMDAIAKMLDDSPELEPFYDWLRRKERRLVKRLELELAEARTSKATRRVSQLSRALRDLGDGADRNIDARLIHATSRAFKKTIALYQHVGPENVPAIHRMRTAFKKFRYMVEALASVVSGITDGQLRAMQAYQTSMGEIQDVDVLLARLAKFADRAEPDESFPAFRERLLRRRARLVNRFLASADKVLNFWPPHAHRAFNRRRTNGVAYSPARGCG